MKDKKVPIFTINRLSHYYRILGEIPQQKVISSQQISQHTGYTDAQIRRDLAYFGQFGVRGRGYFVDDLKKELYKILGLDKKWNVGLIGVGNLGSALLGYRGFRKQGFNIIAAFDADQKKIGKMIHGIKVFHIKDFCELSKALNIQIVVLTLPVEYTQQTVSQILKCKIKAIMNFTPLRLKLPGDINIRNIDLAVEFEQLSFLMK